MDLRQNILGDMVLNGLYKGVYRREGAYGAHAPPP